MPINLDTLLVAIFASSGFWAAITMIIQHHISKKDKEDQSQLKMDQMVLGLGHDRICFLGMSYIARGYITKDEYENLVTYLFEPYEALNGNGTAKLVIDKVKLLPMKQTVAQTERKVTKSDDPMNGDITTLVIDR